MRLGQFGGFLLGGIMDPSSILMQQKLIESTLWNKKSSIIFCNTFIVYSLIQQTVHSLIQVQCTANVFFKLIKSYHNFSTL